MLESGLQSENVTYAPHAARGCIKLQSKQTYGIHTTDNIHIYIPYMGKFSLLKNFRGHSKPRKFNTRNFLNNENLQTESPGPLVAK